MARTNQKPTPQHALPSKMDKSLQVVDQQRSSYHLGLKLMSMLHLGSKRVKPEQSATTHPMNRVKIAPLEHPAPPVPPHAKPATKASSTTKLVVPAATV
jgi:hypothetical protein